MSDLNEMWIELERYQPFAEKHGFGDKWLRMTTERTKEAANAAMKAEAAYAARAAAEAVAWAQHEIDCIRRAIEQEEP